ncbi:MAG: universal stress protein [Thermodesulfatator sp.]|nr:MAG: universal stress protein [Thermodesulfatator sp.]
MNLKKILIAADASENAKRAAAYVGEIIGPRKDFEIEILYVLRYPDRDLFPDADAWENKKDEERKKAQEVLSGLSTVLEEKGIPVSAISTVSKEAKGFSIAQAILEYQQQNGFGTIVVGRRGVSKAEEFLFGSVSNKIVHYARDCAVWVIE